jgi:hypothetical protein
MGSITPIRTEARAVSMMQAKVDEGGFVPDRAINTLKRVG